MPEQEPITRREKYLNALSDETQEIPEPVTREEMFLKKAIESSGGGSSLPEVTSEDNGKALGVVEGAWGKMDIPTELPTVDATDNGKILSVIDGAWEKTSPNEGITKIICNRNKYNTYTIENNLTTTDIINYIENGKNVELYLAQPSGDFNVYRLMASSTIETTFINMYVFSDNLWCAYISISKNNATTISSTVKQLTS